MRLERLEATQRPDKLKAVFDVETLTVSASLCVQFSLCAGMELDEATFSTLKASVAKEAARERAVRILTAYAVSERELEKRLVQKGTLPTDAADAVAWLKEHRFVDDAATAAQLVDSAVRKGYGRARIQNILYEKGIPKNLWDEALARIPAMDDAIDRFLAAKLRGRTADEKTIKKTIDALLRRGFSYGEIRDALRRYEADLEDLELEETMTEELE